MAANNSADPSANNFSPINYSTARSNSSYLAQAEQSATILPVNQHQVFITSGPESNCYLTPYGAMPNPSTIGTQMPTSDSSISAPHVGELDGFMVDKFELTVEEAKNLKDRQHDFYSDFWILRDNWAPANSENAELFDKIDTSRYTKIYTLGRDLENLLSLTIQIHAKLAEGGKITKKVAESMLSKHRKLSHQLQSMIRATSDLRQRLEGGGHKYPVSIKFKVIGNQAIVPKTTKHNTKRGLTPASIHNEVSLGNVFDSLEETTPSGEPPNKKRFINDGKYHLKIVPKVSAMKASSHNSFRTPTLPVNGFGAPASLSDTLTPDSSFVEMLRTTIGTQNDTLGFLKNIVNSQAETIKKQNDEVQKVREEKDAMIKELKQQMEVWKRSDNAR